jgi:carbon storage regulator
MLVLSRECGEKIVFPGLGVTLTVLEICGEKARLGISAPADLAIHRLEVWQRLRERRAAEDAPDGAVAVKGRR